MSSLGESLTLATEGFVDLSKLDIPTPPGWSNKRDDLSIGGCFEPGQLIPKELSDHGYSNVLPVVTGNLEQYVIEAQRRGVKQYFVWNAISGRLMRVERNLALKEVMNMAGISVLSIDMTLLATTWALSSTGGILV